MYAPDHTYPHDLKETQRLNPMNHVYILRALIYTFPMCVREGLACNLQIFRKDILLPEVAET